MYKYALMQNNNNNNNTCTCMNISNGSKSKRKFMTTEALEALFQNDYSDSHSDSSSHNIHESDSEISINTDHN